ncbi:hypothetical protein ASPWEDRAFT_91928, partial [Aspergillus wentii DTO 134E9]
LFVLAAVVRLVSCQTTASVDTGSLDQSTKDSWCQSQTSSCPLICLQLPGATGNTKENSCNAKTLDYSCVCSNGLSPNASQYSLTIPYFLCTEANNECVNNCNGGDSSCQSACRTKNPCGAQNPKRVNTTASATPTATSSASATDVVYNGFGATSTGSSEKGMASKALAINLGQVYGLFVVMGGFLVGFTTLL